MLQNPREEIQIELVALVVLFGSRRLFSRLGAPFFLGLQLLFDQILVVLLPPLDVALFQIIDQLVVDASEQSPEVDGGYRHHFFLHLPKVLGIQGSIP